MKKILSLALIALLSSPVFAGSHSEKRMNLSVGASNLGDASATEYSFGFEGRRVWDSGLVLASNMTVTMISLDQTVENETDLIAMDLDFKIGYNYKDLTVCGFGTMTANSIVYGYGAGIGVEYRAAD